MDARQHSPLAVFPSLGREMGRPPPPDCPLPLPPARLPASDGFELESEGGIVLSPVAVAADVDAVEAPPSDMPSAAAKSFEAPPSGLGSCGGILTHS